MVALRARLFAVPPPCSHAEASDPKDSCRDMPVVTNRLHEGVARITRAVKRRGANIPD